MKNAGRMGFDMDQFEKYLGDQLPFLPKGLLRNHMKMSGSWIGDYVQDVLNRSFANAAPEGGEATEEAGEEEAITSAETKPMAEGLSYEHEVFETHNSVIVRVKIPDKVNYRNVRAYAGSHQLKLEQDPSRKKQYVRLPVPVDPDTTKAVYKDGILEIRMPKMDEAEVFRELRVRLMN